MIIPILAGAFGNYLIPLMIGADDMAFPDAEHDELLVHVASLPLHHGMSFFAPGNGAACRLDQSYPPLSVLTESRRPPVAGTAQTLWLLACNVCWHLVHDGVGQLHDDNHPDAGAWDDDVPLAFDHLGDVHHGGLCRRLPCPILTAAGFMQLTDRMSRHRLLLGGRGHGRQQHAAGQRVAAASRCCGSTCSGSIRTPRFTS